MGIENKAVAIQYSNVADVKPTKRIGDRPFTIFEEGNMLLLGLTEEQARTMTPRALEELANVRVTLGSPVLLGS